MQFWHHNCQETLETILPLHMPCSAVTNLAKSGGKKGNLYIPSGEHILWPQQANFKTNLLNSMEIFFFFTLLLKFQTLAQNRIKLQNWLLLPGKEIFTFVLECFPSLVGIQAYHHYKPSSGRVTGKNVSSESLQLRISSILWHVVENL